MFQLLEDITIAGYSRFANGHHLSGKLGKLKTLVAVRGLKRRQSENALFSSEG